MNTSAPNIPECLAMALRMMVELATSWPNAKDAKARVFPSIPSRYSFRAFAVNVVKHT